MAQRTPPTRHHNHRRLNSITGTYDGSSLSSAATRRDSSAGRHGPTPPVVKQRNNNVEQRDSPPSLACGAHLRGSKCDVNY